MGRKTLSTLILVLFIALAVVVISSDRGVSGVMEDIGKQISRLIN